jgi:hypothetical protein
MGVKLGAASSIRSWTSSVLLLLNVFDFDDNYFILLNALKCDKH